MQTNLSVRFLDITNQKSSGVKKWDVPTWPDSDRMMRHYRSFLWSFISKELIWTCEWWTNQQQEGGDKGWDIEQFCFWSFCSGWDICLHWRDDFRCKISFKMSTMGLFVIHFCTKSKLAQFQSFWMNDSESCEGKKYFIL